MSAQRTPTRIALYSHDAQGLGHIRRNLLIARALTQGTENPAILLLSGVHEGSWFEFPAGVDCLTLPSLAKRGDGTYEPRSLGVTTRELVGIRRATIEASLSSFDPDVLIVDKIPLGAFEELRTSLDRLRRRGRTKIVLGLRDILDDPAVVAREWRSQGFDEAVETYFDRIWIYGDRDVYDATEAYGFSADQIARTRFTGFLNPLDVESVEPASNGNDRRLALGLVGGGRDGLELAKAFADADLPDDTDSLLITGPLMPSADREELEERMSRRPRSKLLSFVTDPTPYLQRAWRIVSMGGYNTVCEIVAHRVPGLIVPRVHPRTEQHIRADCFEAHGLVHQLHPRKLSGGAISDWFRDSAPDDRPPDPDRIDFRGVSRLPGLMQEAASHRPAGHGHVAI